MENIHAKMSKLIDYHIEGRVPELLRGSDYQWFATGRFGLDLLLERPLSKVDVFSIYVPKDQLRNWSEYLKGNKGNITNDPTNVNLRIIPIEDYSEFMTTRKDYSLSRDRVLKRLLIHINEARRNLSHKPRKTTKRVHFSEFHRHLTITGSSNIAPPRRLAKDILTSAPRYWDNLVTRLEEE